MLLLLLLVCLVLDVLLQIRERIMWHAQRVEWKPRYSNKSAGFHRPIRLDERTTELRAKY